MKNPQKEFSYLSIGRTIETLHYKPVTRQCCEHESSHGSVLYDRQLSIFHCVQNVILYVYSVKAMGGLLLSGRSRGLGVEKGAAWHAALEK